MSGATPVAYPAPEDERETLAALFVAHQRIPTFDAAGPFAQRCTGCDYLRGETDGPNSPRQARHLADVALDSDWLAAHDAALVARVADFVEGLTPPSGGVPVWRSEVAEAIRDHFVRVATKATS